MSLGVWTLIWEDTQMPRSSLIGCKIFRLLAKLPREKPKSPENAFFVSEHQGLTRPSLTLRGVQTCESDYSICWHVWHFGEHYPLGQHISADVLCGRLLEKHWEVQGRAAWRGKHWFHAPRSIEVHKNIQKQTIECLCIGFSKCLFVIVKGQQKCRHAASAEICHRPLPGRIRRQMLREWLGRHLKARDEKDGVDFQWPHAVARLTSRDFF